MLYILGIVVAVIGAGSFLTGLLSFKARDKHSVQHYSDDAYFQQTLNHMSQNNHNPF